MINSRFTPSSSEDTLTFQQMTGVDEGVFGTGNNDPQIVVLQNVPFERDLSTGDLVRQLEENDFTPDTRFRRLTGRLELDFQS